MQVPITDSKMTLGQSLAGKEISAEIKNTLALVTVPYISFDSLVHEGQLVVHKKVAEELQAIFFRLLDLKFPIKHARPIVDYGWGDDASMADNNTSAFNYRFIHGTSQLSNHSYGLAIDINPTLNPYVRRDGATMPLGATYDISNPGTITPKIVSLFKSYGWEWGGDWERKDWQHFQKTL